MPKTTGVAAGGTAAGGFDQVGQKAPDWIRRNRGSRTDSRLLARLRAVRTRPALTATSTMGRGILSGTNSAMTPVSPFTSPDAVPQRLGSKAVSCENDGNCTAACFEHNSLHLTS